ncbi:hypothetical protein AMS68_007294 [Peltaster fructicola]|uniref:Transcription factor IIIC subunit 5 HTH domain-containing protein n=1 Tax=Peltaster fructicola TaxID=286661 RepID=A0A6H0Y428_9PEZI|nr:hypothetical protein AMS68_007294 [Peltaster fructicola]
MPAIYQTTQEQPPHSLLADVLRDAALAEDQDVPNHRIISIEHPCIIRSLENGLKSMGGEPRMKHILEHQVGDSLQNPQKPKPEPELGVSLRPNDPLAARLTSTGVDTRNVLLKITLPKRTGRKRKRGSDLPWEESTTASVTTSITAPELLKRLKDNEDKYVLETVSLVQETHRFRNLPDFQTKAGDLPIFQELTAHVLQPSYSKLKEFTVDATPGLPTMTSFPGPPSFAAAMQAYRYEYQQASGVRFSRDEDGNIHATNLQAPARKLMKAVAPDCDEVPQGPPAELKVQNPWGTFLPRIIDELRKLLEVRPLVTRRVAVNHITQCSDTLFREATQWVGYNFSAGPFRDTLIKYGVDPRKDPKYRIYQTLMFQLDKRAARAAGEKNEKWNRSYRVTVDYEQPLNNSHLFDGQHISANGKTWQICDITDPLIKQLFDTEELPSVCDVHSYGWYYGGTICRARIIMREKIEKLFEGKPIPDEVYAMVASLPVNIDDWTYEKTVGFFADKPGGKEAASLTAEARSLTKAGHKQYLQLKYGRDSKAGKEVDGEPEAPIAEDAIQGDLDEALEEDEPEAADSE